MNNTLTLLCTVSFILGVLGVLGHPQPTMLRVLDGRNRLLRLNRNRWMSRVSTTNLRGHNRTVPLAVSSIQAMTESLPH